MSDIVFYVRNDVVAFKCQGFLNLMVIIVTGANTGIGFGIVQRLLIHHRSQGSCPTIVMACRNLQKAQDAKNQLLNEFFPVDGE